MGWSVLLCCCRLTAAWHASVLLLQVQVPPALAASSKPQQDFDYDFERKVMSNDASTSFDAFMAKPEVCACGGRGRALICLCVHACCCRAFLPSSPSLCAAHMLTVTGTPPACVLQTAYYDSTKASRFIRAGFSPAVVNLALAYNATNRGDEAQVRDKAGLAGLRHPEDALQPNSSSASTTAACGCPSCCGLL